MVTIVWPNQRNSCAKRICSDRNGDWVDRLDYQVDVCEHFTHSSENGSIVAALSDCHNGKFVSGFLSSRNQLSFDIANTGLETKSNEKGHVRLDLVSSLPETKSSLIDPSLFIEMDDAFGKRSVAYNLNNSTLYIARKIGVVALLWN